MSWGQTWAFWALGIRGRWDGRGLCPLGDPAHRETRAGTLRTVARRGFSCWGAQGPFREVTSEGLAVWGRGCAKAQLGQSCAPRKGDPPGRGARSGVIEGPGQGPSLRLNS